jgi:hypothetical protein
MPGYVLVADYDAVNKVLCDPSFAVTDAADSDREFTGWREHASLSDFMHSILNVNPPDHPRMRSIMVRAFTARRVAALEPAIAWLTDGLLDTLAERGAAGQPAERGRTAGQPDAAARGRVRDHHQPAWQRPAHRAGGSAAAARAEGEAPPLSCGCCPGFPHSPRRASWPGARDWSCAATRRFRSGSSSGPCPVPGHLVAVGARRVGPTRHADARTPRPVSPVRPLAGDPRSPAGVPAVCGPRSRTRHLRRRRRPGPRPGWSG